MAPSIQVANWVKNPMNFVTRVSTVGRAACAARANAMIKVVMAAVLF